MRTSERSLWAFMFNRCESAGGDSNLLSSAAAIKIVGFAL
jgi:hypothetical protein